MVKEYLSTGEAARMLGISRATVSRKYDQGILSGYKNPLTGERFISRESAQALLAKVTESGALARDMAQHARQFPRTNLEVPVEIRVYVPRDPDRKLAGRGILENISLGGAYVSRLEMNDGCLPAEPFRAEILVDHPPFHQWRADGKVVRLESDEYLSAAIEFDTFSGMGVQELQKAGQVS